MMFDQECLKNISVSLSRIEAFEADIAESLAVMSGRKKPYTPSFEDCCCWQQNTDTTPSVQVSGELDHGD